MMRSCLRIGLVFVGWWLLLPAFAQPITRSRVDSVTVTGRIRNLSARLYREAPTVFVSRNNILQASRELVRPAPLNIDGSFRVTLPLIYPLEEMYFNYGRISTAFLAGPGTLTIDLNADSLFNAAVPFRFAGVNAQVNQQFARYKAFEAAYPEKITSEKLMRVVREESTNSTAFRKLKAAYLAPFREFAKREQPFPLVTRWIIANGAYNAAGFLYEKVTYEEEKLPTALNDSLRPPDDRLLTAARTTAMNRFAGYVNAQITRQGGQAGSVSVRALATILERYGRDLTDEERERLDGYKTKSTAKQADLRFFDGLVRRNPDTLQRLVTYENLLNRARQQFDSLSVDYYEAYLLASSLPGLTLDFARLLYSYARPQINNPELATSLDELYRLEVKDSTRIRAAIQKLSKAGSAVQSLEMSPGVFVTSDRQSGGKALFDRIVNANRGKVIYVLIASPDTEEGRQAAQDAQQLRSTYSVRDFALIYLPVAPESVRLWSEFAVKNQLAGDHLLASPTQLEDINKSLRADSELSATVIGRTGKIIKRNAPLPGAPDEAKKIIDKGL